MASPQAVDRSATAAVPAAGPQPTGYGSAETDLSPALHRSMDQRLRPGDRGRPPAGRSAATAGPATGATGRGTTNASPLRRRSDGGPAQSYDRALQATGPATGAAPRGTTNASPVVRRSAGRSLRPENGRGSPGGRSAVAVGPRTGPSEPSATGASPVGRRLDRTAVATPIAQVSPTRPSAVAAGASRWSGHRCPMSAILAHDDPRCARLPYGDGVPRYIAATAPTAESARLAMGLLARTGWCLHRIGAAAYGHHPSNRRWLIGWQIGDQRPAWWDGLIGRAAVQGTAA